MRISPLPCMAAALVGGILAAPLLAPVPLAITAAVAALFGFGGFCLLKRHPSLAFLCWMLPFAVWGAALAQQRGNPAPDDVSRLAGRPSTWLIGTVAAEPESQSSGNIRYTLAVTAEQSGVPVSGNLLVTQTPQVGAAPPRFGETVAVRGLVEPPPSATNPDGFDYRAFLRRKSIFATLATKRGGDVRHVPGRITNNPFREVASRTHGALMAAVARAPLPPDERALVAGVLLSEREGIPYETQVAFEKTGAVHILSVSGLHLAVFAAVLSFALRHLPAKRGLRDAANVAAVLLLWTFALASGFSSATVRSAVMLTVILLAPVFRRDAEPLHALAVAGFVILLCDPLALYDVGAQLSFACIGGLLLWMNPMRNWLFPLEYRMPLATRIGRGAVLLLLTGFVAQLSALPLTAYHFSLASVIAPVAGVLLVPVAELLLLSGLSVSGLSAVFAPLPGVFWAPVHALCGLLIAITRSFATPDFAAVSLPPPPPASVALFYLAFAGLGLWFRRQMTRREFLSEAASSPPVSRLAMVTLLAFVVAPVLVVLPPVTVLRRERQEQLRITFLDVGQGDSAVIETPDGAVAVIDGGGNPGTDERYGGDPGSRILVPFLRRRGINRIDWLIPSHPDEDHTQGLVAAVHALSVRRVLDGGVPDAGYDASSRLREVLRSKGVLQTRAMRGQSIPLGATGVAMEVLHPPRPLLTDTRSVTNENSIVLRLRYKNAAVLFTGDAGEDAERSLLGSGQPLRSDVLKVGHHGSRFSTGVDFLAAVSPRAAVVSAGRKNNFNHPSPDVIAKLAASGAAIYRTDRQGAVVLTTDGERISLTATAK